MHQLQRFVLLLVLSVSLLTICNAEDLITDPIDERPIIVTGLGRIQGSVLKSRMGSLFYGFRGIPYGKAPVGDLRFKVTFIHI